MNIVMVIIVIIIIVIVIIIINNNNIRSTNFESVVIAVAVYWLVSSSCGIQLVDKYVILTSVQAWRRFR
jgi:hypothetical protein